MVTRVVVVCAMSLLGAEPAVVQDPEILGRVAEEQDRTDEALSHYFAALKSLPDPPPAEADLRLRERIVRLVVRSRRPPDLPEDAIRFVTWGMTAFKDAESPEDFERAAAQLRKAVRLAPWYPVALFNLAVVQERLSDYHGALENLRLYRLLVPRGPDAERARIKAYELEYRAQGMRDKAKRFVEWGELEAEEVSPALAVQLYREACESAYAKGCMKLARAYSGGWGVAQDTNLAFKWYQRACELRGWDGCAQIGQQLLRGEGVQADPKRGLALLERVCSVTDAGWSHDALLACISLGKAYRSGDIPGVPADTKAAATYYAKACALGDTTSCKQAKKLGKSR